MRNTSTTATATVNFAKSDILKKVFLSLRPATDRDVPKLKWLDLELVFYLDLGEGDVGIVTQNTLDVIPDLTVDDLIVAGTNKVFNNLKTFNLGSLFSGADSSMPTVITNESCIFGAVALFFPDILDKVCEERSCEKLAIMPSSIHEILAIADDGTIDHEAMNEMVRMVNATEVAEKDVLADHIYLYDRETGTVTF